MESDRFDDDMRRRQARHEEWIAEIQESLGQLSHTAQLLVDNQVFLQDQIRDGFDRTQRQIDATQRQIDSLSRVAMHHVTDPTAHQG